MQSLLSMNDMLGDRARILVIAPGDAVGVWQDEVVKWLDEEPAVFAGTKADATATSHQGVVISNYHRMGATLTQHWDGVIFDESQMLRNKNTETLFRFVRRQFASGTMRKVPAFFLSGTPIVKHTGDIWPILHLINRRRWSAYWTFVEKYSNVWQDDYGWHVEGVTNLKALWAELAEVALRRTEGEVPLPPKIRQRIPLKMTPRQAKAYKDLMRDMYTEVDNGDGYLLTPSVLAREQRLRQLLACPRVLGIDDDGAALRAIGEIAEREAEPFVIFTPFEKVMPYAATHLGRLGRPTYSVHGGMGAKFHQNIQMFKESSKRGFAPILLCTVQMGRSWDVAQYTHRVRFLGVDWNETTQDQAESRVQRDGQTETTFADYFVHEGTHDVDALDILAGKKRLADAILDHKTPKRSAKAKLIRARNQR